MPPFDVKKVRELMRRLDHKSGRFRIVDTDEAAGILRAAGRRPICVLGVTANPDLPKDSPHKGKVVALKLRSMQLNVPYEEAAHKVDPDFTVRPRQWGAVVGLPFVVHKDKLYLSCHIRKTHAEQYLDKESGEVIPLDPQPPMSFKGPITYRNYLWDGVLGFRVGKRSYLVKKEK